MTTLEEYIVKLDHIAYRVKRGEREKLIQQFTDLADYKFYKSFTVKKSNAITSCLKLHGTLPVIVISEGLTEDSIVEKYCNKFGSRVHHLAYLVTDIEKVVNFQKTQGVKFTTEKIIGSEKEGIKQIFTFPIPETNHIIEYIQRFGNFDGFFTPSNISDLMNSTEELGES
ncbi:MAG: VOC family protein [Candidatus Hodarchaeales archaeon]